MNTNTIEKLRDVSPLYKELELKQIQGQESYKGRIVLGHLYLLKSGKTGAKKCIREILGLTQGSPSNVNNMTLQDVYKGVVEKLNQKYKPETSQTSYEKIFKRTFKQYTRADIVPSVWIGSYCLDLFIARARMAIEINGGIHNTEFKMRKDEHKESYLKHLNIAVANIDNKRTSKQAPDLAILIKNKKHIGSCNVKRLWREIYIRTITSHTPFDELDLLFGYEQGVCQKVYDAITAHKGK